MVKKSVGKGRKTCPQCKTVVGARLQKCSCGHEFKAKTKTAKKGLEGSIEAIRAMGGLKFLEKNLRAFDAVCQPILDLGGPERAKALLEQLEALKSL